MNIFLYCLGKSLDREVAVFHLLISEVAGRLQQERLYCRVSFFPANMLPKESILCMVNFSSFQEKKSAKNKRIKVEKVLFEKK